MAKRKPREVRSYGPALRGGVVTEEQWLASNDAVFLLNVLEPWVADEVVTDRPLRLFACACARLLGPKLKPSSHQCIELGERYTEGTATEDELLARLLLSQSRGGRNRAVYREPPEVRCCLLLGYMSGDGGTYYYLMDIIGELARRKTNADPREADILRDIIGNPFQRVRFANAWRTADTQSIAAKWYDDGDPRALPILADALEEAGCDDAMILTHCREPGHHVRGCWVIDGVLEKR